MTEPEEHTASAARRGGRPSLQEAAQLQETILDVATELFLTQGFEATSIEAVATRARMSKRTFYHRFKDKGALFEAVVRRLIERWLPPFEARLHETGNLAEILRGTARQILVTALLPEALALHRVVTAEAHRFPALAEVMNESGSKSGIDRIAALLDREALSGHLRVGDTRFAAEQFLYMVVSAPQRRALGFGKPLAPGELDEWAARTVDLFLQGCQRAADTLPQGRCSPARR